jgi:hypothetical protein
VQNEILAKNPELRVRVFIIWLPMLLGDSREAWDPAVISDDRVTHLWDERRLAGRWFGAHQPPS